MPTEQDYTAQAQALLPHGPAWTRAPEAVLTKILSAFGAMHADIDIRAERLIKGANPIHATELLEEWELSTGLPDTCAGAAADKTIQGRQQEIVVKLNAAASPTLDYFISVVRGLGYDADLVEIQEFHTFRCGASRCGDALNTGDDAHALLFIIKQSERLVALECKLNILKPSHIIFYYLYTGGN